MRLLILIGCLFGSAVFGEEAIYQFRWEGANGYAVSGALSYRADLLTGPIVMGDDVTCFAIEGRKEDEVIGSWTLGQRAKETTWRLHFSPVNESFVVVGFLIRQPQAWNMNGRGNDCGLGGFGLNIGNLGQDLCIDNQPIIESRVSPFKPFPAQKVQSYAFPAGACLGPELYSRLVVHE